VLASDGSINPGNAAQFAQHPNQQGSAKPVFLAVPSASSTRLPAGLPSCSRRSAPAA
jgi:hypothetical protein